MGDFNAELPDNFLDSFVKLTTKEVLLKNLNA